MFFIVKGVYRKKDIKSLKYRKKNIQILKIKKGASGPGCGQQCQKKIDGSKHTIVVFRYVAS